VEFVQCSRWRLVIFHHVQGSQSQSVWRRAFSGRLSEPSASSTTRVKSRMMLEAVHPREHSELAGTLERCLGYHPLQDRLSQSRSAAV
jgi:hypothetical protein